MTTHRGAWAGRAEPSVSPADSERLLERGGPAGYALLLLHSVGRHRSLFFLTWAGVVGLSLLLLWGMPKTYEVSTTVQTQASTVLSDLSRGSSPNNAPTSDPEAPNRQAAETVLSHENLISLVRQTGMVEKWPLRRAPLLRLKDAVMEHVGTPPSPADQQEGFVGLLEKKLTVQVGKGSVTIAAALPDPQLAFHVVETALQNFLEARHTAEISTIEDAITILEARVAEARKQVDSSLGHLQDVRAARSTRLRRPAPRIVLREAPAAPDQAGSKLQDQVESRRRALADLEEFRKRRIAELTQKVQEARALYSNKHPTLVDLEESLEEAHRESPQVTALRHELEPLEAELSRRGLLGDVPLRAPRVHDVSAQAAALEDDDDPTESQDAEIDYAKTQVRHALTRYNALVDRIESARIEEDAAQAAFKYRYVVIYPPQRPRSPTKPKPALVILASVLVGLLLGCMATALLDVSSKAFVEDWQVEDALRLHHFPSDPRALWAALQLRPWTSLALICPEADQAGLELAGTLVETAKIEPPDVLKVVSVLGAARGRAEAIATALERSAGHHSTRFLVAADNPLANPFVAPVVEACDQLLLVLSERRSAIALARQTVNAIGREHFLGAVLLRRR